jgi:PKD repeat protein
MRKILPLLFSLFIFSSRPAFSQITCDTSGNVVLYSNYDGGILNINVDVNIPNLKIGVVSYEMVTINLSGPYVNNITEIQFAGYTTTTHHHCNNSPAVTSIVGAPPGTDTLIFMPNSPVANANGYYIIICNTSCDTTTNQGGCNTPDQIAAYFQQEFGGLLRYHFTQYGCWNGTYNISDGGNCCISAFTPPPVAMFSANNQLCPGTCTDFQNLSTNATSFLWLFPGSATVSSTDENPTNICYNTPGSYDVTLIATGPGGTDTIQLNNYITVFPLPPAQSITQSYDTLFAIQGSVSYQWYLNASVIPGATDYFYVATINGSYSVVATDANGCEVEAVTVWFNPDFIPEQNGGEKFLLSPVPANDFLKIEKPGSTEKITMKIYNVVGNCITLPMAIGSQLPVCSADISFLPPGIYFLEISSSQGISRMKFVKK